MPTVTEAIPEPPELPPASTEEPLTDLPTTEEIENRLKEQGLEVEVKELSDGTEIAVINKEWKLEKIYSWAAIVNGPENAQINGREINYSQERILAFSNNTRGAYMAEAGRLMKWEEGDWRGVELPGGVNEIAFLDKHQGDWYGITHSDRAVVKLVGGRWERYQRPVEVAYPSYSYPGGEGLPPLPEEMDENKVQRLFDSQGNEVPFGYLFDVSPNEDGRPTHVFVSGYPLGFFEHGYPSTFPEDLRDPTHRFNGMIFEIPLRYERLLLITGVGGSTSGTNIFPNLHLIPASRNINERRRQPATYVDIRDAFLNSGPFGNQMVFAFQTKNKNDLPTTVLWNAGWEELLAEFKRGEAAVDVNFNWSFIWVDEALFSK